jgi:hypothetical protein
VQDIIELIFCRANLSDPSNLVIDVDYRLPTAFVEGEYKAHGKIVGFPIGGKGVYNISMRKDVFRVRSQEKLVIYM